MYKKILSLMFMGLLLNLTFVSFAYGESKEEKKMQMAEKVRAGITKIGTGETALVEIRLHDKTKLKGYVKEIGNNSFTIVNLSTNQETSVDYPQVKQIKGNNLSTGAKVAIGLGILAGVLVILLIFENYG
jgi:hypothetical protein